MWTTTTQNRMWLKTLTGAVNLDLVESIAVRSVLNTEQTKNLYDVVAYIHGSTRYYTIAVGFKTEAEALVGADGIVKSL